MRIKFLVRLLASVFVITASTALAQRPEEFPRIGIVRRPVTLTIRIRWLNHWTSDPKSRLLEGKNRVRVSPYTKETWPGSRPLSPNSYTSRSMCYLDLDRDPAVEQATKTIPIVMVTSPDPVAAGLVDSLAHPGGNITGITRLTRELSGKRLELLTEMIPRL